MPRISKNKSVSLALQGGGAHGAFTWGVLDTLFDHGKIEIEAISGTSAGAMNAVVMAYGLTTGGVEHARDMLHEFWHKVSCAAALFPVQPTLFDKMFGNDALHNSPAYMALDMMTRLFSPYQTNIFNLNPLRDILEKLIDFEVLRNCNEIQLFLNATNVRTGKGRIFRTEEITLDVVMASACLPFLYKAVEIDGEHYWDGGYAGNPALYPLFYQCGSSDIIIVQINPIEIDELPTEAGPIMDRVNEISFNANLINEVRAIHFVKKLLKEKKIENSHYKDIRLHRIASDELMAPLGQTSKLNADWEFLLNLKDKGVITAKSWIEEHHKNVGKKSTVNIAEVYL